MGESGSRRILRRCSLRGGAVCFLQESFQEPPECGQLHGGHDREERQRRNLVTRRDDRTRKKEVILDECEEEEDPVPVPPEMNNPVDEFPGCQQISRQRDPEQRNDGQQHPEFAAEIVVDRRKKPLFLHDVHGAAPGAGDAEDLEESRRVWQQDVRSEVLWQPCERMGEDEFSIMFLIDIDNFKRINDTRGHQAGDEYLKRFASILKHVFRKSDIVYRMGGDEFIGFAESISMPELAVERIMTRLYQQLEQAEKEGFGMQCSAGIFIGSRRNSYSDFYAMADRALYAAKRTGKNKYPVISESSAD